MSSPGRRELLEAVLRNIELPVELRPRKWKRKERRITRKKEQRMYQF